MFPHLRPPIAVKELINSFTQYLGAIWNVINFEEAEARFVEAT